MNIQNIDISKVTTADLYKYTVNELVYIYLAVFKMPACYDIENIEHQKLLYSDFKDFIKNTKHLLTENQFISECRWWWCLIPIGNEQMITLNNPISKRSKLTAIL